MAVRIIVGVPGSGKTYYAMDHILSNYFKWDETLGWWVPNDPKLYLATNIDGCRIGLNLNAEIQQAGGMAKYFEFGAMEKMLGGRSAVLVIDEAQIWFDMTFKEKAVFTFFQKARHIGVDVYLLTQDIETMARPLRRLPEYIVYASPRVMSFLGEFKYTYRGLGQKASFRKRYLRRRQEVFASYVSMTGDEKEKIPSAPRRFAVIILLTLLLTGCVLGYFRHWFVSHMEAQPAGAMVPKVGSVLPVDPGKGGVNGARPGQSVPVQPARLEVRSGGAGGGAAASAAGVPVVAPRPAPPGGGDDDRPTLRIVGRRRVSAVVGEEGRETVIVETMGGRFRSVTRADFIHYARMTPESAVLDEWVPWWRTVSEAELAAASASEQAGPTPSHADAATSTASVPAPAPAVSVR